MPDPSKNTSELTAAELYAIKYENKWSEYFDLGDRIQIQMGYLPEYKNIVTHNIITDTTYFDGSTCTEVLDDNGNAITLLAQDGD